MSLPSHLPKCRIGNPRRYAHIGRSVLEGFVREPERTGPQQCVKWARRPPRMTRKGLSRRGKTLKTIEKKWRGGRVVEGT